MGFVMSNLVGLWAWDYGYWRVGMWLAAPAA